MIEDVNEKKGTAVRNHWIEHHEWGSLSLAAQWLDRALFTEWIEQYAFFLALDLNLWTGKYQPLPPGNLLIEFATLKHLHRNELLGCLKPLNFPLNPHRKW
jgi:hypothetical protein